MWYSACSVKQALLYSLCAVIWVSGSWSVFSHTYSCWTLSVLRGENEPFEDHSFQISPWLLKVCLSRGTESKLSTMNQIIASQNIESNLLRQTGWMYTDFHLSVCFDLGNLNSLVPLSPPSWTFSLHDAPAKQKVSWRTPPTPPTVSSSSYPQVDGTGVSEPAPPDCSTAFSPRLWEPWTHITQPLSETPNNTPPPPSTHLTTSQEKTVKLLSLWNSGERACTSYL